MLFLIRYYIATAALLLVTVIWGSSFPLSKIILAEISPLYYLGIRYTITTVVMVLLFHRQLHKYWRTSLKPALPLGFAVFFAYILQTIGVIETTASKAGFFTAFAVILVPLMMFFLQKQKPPRSLLTGVVLAAIGLSLLSGILEEQLSFNLGDFLVLLSAVCFAVHIILIARLKSDSNAVCIATIQFAVVALFSFLFAFFLEEIPLSVKISPSSWLILIFLAVFATAFAFTVQILAQKEMSAGQTAMIMTFEPVFSAGFSWLLLKEQFTLIGLCGGLLIVAGMLISQFYPVLEAKRGKKALQPVP